MPATTPRPAYRGSASRGWQIGIGCPAPVIVDGVLRHHHAARSLIYDLPTPWARLSYRRWMRSPHCDCVYASCDGTRPLGELGYDFGISRCTVWYYAQGMGAFFVDVLGCSAEDVGSQIVDTVCLVDGSLVPTFRWLPSRADLSSDTG